MIERDVLVVDDQAPFRAVVRTLIAMTPGLRIAGEAESGEEAVEMAAAGAPGVVLMDINLPGMSGFDAARRILATHPRTFVVLVSTYAPEDLPERPAACGAVGYLRKEDLTPSTLLGLVAPAEPPARVPGT